MYVAGRTTGEGATWAASSGASLATALRAFGARPSHVPTCRGSFVRTSKVATLPLNHAAAVAAERSLIRAATPVLNVEGVNNANSRRLEELRRGVAGPIRCAVITEHSKGRKDRRPDRIESTAASASRARARPQRPPDSVRPVRPRRGAAQPIAAGRRARERTRDGSASWFPTVAPLPGGRRTRIRVRRAPYRQTSATTTCGRRRRQAGSLPENSPLPTSRYACNLRLRVPRRDPWPSLSPNSETPAGASSRASMAIATACLRTELAGQGRTCNRACACGRLQVLHGAHRVCLEVLG